MDLGDGVSPILALSKIEAVRRTRNHFELLLESGQESCIGQGIHIDGY